MYILKIEEPTMKPIIDLVGKILAAKKADALAAAITHINSVR